MIYALLLLYANATFPVISWHDTPDRCRFEAIMAAAKANPPVVDAACVGVRVSDLVPIHREVVIGEIE